MHAAPWTTADRCKFAQNYLNGLHACINALSLVQVDAIVAQLEKVYRRGGRVFIVGNGGSAATASHMACDLGKAVSANPLDTPRRGFKAIALTDNVPLITAWANDKSYDQIFAEQIRTLAHKGDLLIAISGSGNSLNVLEAVRAARACGVTTIGILGFDGGRLRQMVDNCIVVPSDDYGYVEDIHMVLNHLITAYFKEWLKHEG